MAGRRLYICVTSFFPSQNSWRGGYVLDQVKAIERNSDFEVVVFNSDRSAGDDDYEIQGIKVYRYHTRNLPSTVLNGIFNEYNAKSFVGKALAVGVDPKRVAYVHCHVSMHAACGLALKKLNPKIRVLLQHHDLDPFNLRSGVLFRDKRWNIRYRSRKAIELYNQVDLHICVSEACKDSLVAFPNTRKGEVYSDYIGMTRLAKGLSGIQPKHTYVLYNGVDTSLFHTEDSKKDIFRIGCIANFQELKDHITLIKAFELLIKKGYDMRLSLLGTGGTRQECELYISEHGLNAYVEWPEEVVHDKLAEYYRTLSLFVLPSYFEGFGCVYTETVACGVPFMGCINQGYSEYVSEDEKMQWLVAPHDYVKLAENIENYYLNPVQQHLTRDYDINILIQDYIKYLESVNL